MAKGLNKVILLGNLGADPELRHTQNGGAVLNMSLATTKTWLDRDKQRQESTQWHNVVVWGKRAEGLGSFLEKGHCLLVEGEIRYSTYEDRDGNKRWKTEIHATEIVMAGGGGGRRERADQQQRGGQTEHRTQEPSTTAPAHSMHERFGPDGGDQSPPAGGPNDDDIPF